MKKMWASLLLCLPMVAMAEKTSNRLNDAAAVLSEVMSAPDKGIPTNLLARAQCIVIVPGLKSGAFVVGVKYGKGFVSCRHSGGGWSAPASVRVEGGSIGFQAGGIESDLVLLVMNNRGAKQLSSQFTVGGEGQAAAGPVGRASTAQTDASLRAEMLSWSRARGVFAGVSLQGATLRQDVDDNASIYGRPLKNKEIVFGDVAWPDDGSELHSVLNKYAARARRLKHRK